MKSEIRKITPRIAEQLLELNKSNRRLKQVVINSYAKDMKKGNWKLTGEAIKISKTNKLLDGQHRLHAIIKAQTPIDMLIISQLDDEIFNVLDTGSMRSASDVLSILGVQNPTLTSSIARFAINFKNDIYSSKKNSRSDKPTNEDIQKFVEENEEIKEIVRWTIENSRNFKALNPSIIGGMYWVLSRINVTDCDTFFGRLIYGLELKQDCPVRLLRERFLGDTLNKSKLPLHEKVKLICQAWNLFRKGSSVKLLKVHNTTSKINLI